MSGNSWSSLVASRRSGYTHRAVLAEGKICLLLVHEILNIKKKTKERSNRTFGSPSSHFTDQPIYKTELKIKIIRRENYSKRRILFFGSMNRSAVARHPVLTPTPSRKFQSNAWWNFFFFSRYSLASYNTSYNTEHRHKIRILFFFPFT